MSRGIILVVEDSRTAQEQIKNSLCEHFECIPTSDGVEALRIVRMRKIDIVLTDLHMPKMSGVDLLRALKTNETTKQIPVLVMTTETGLGEVNTCRRLGCAGYLLKPVDMGYLIARVRTLRQAIRPAT
jgi:DNA-binding response OmpR family regulator